MKRVLIGTPCYDGKIDVWYANSVVNCVRIAEAKGVFIHPIWLSYDALVQRARNDLMSIALNQGYDCLVFVDSDVEFSPEWLLELIESEEDVIGGTYPKKGETESYPVKALTDQNGELLLVPDSRGLLEVLGLGTGFVKISRAAIQALWDTSPVYKNTETGTDNRMMCNVEVRNGVFMSEDILLFERLRDMGFRVWLDPKMTCNHTGNKKYRGDFLQYLKGITDTRS